LTKLIIRIITAFTEARYGIIEACYDITKVHYGIKNACYGIYSSELRRVI